MGQLTHKTIRTMNFHPYPTHLAFCSFESVLRGPISHECVRVQPFVIAWLDSNAAFDIHDSKLICGSLDFLGRYCRYFVSRYADYLHQGSFAVQILGVILGLIPGTLECTRMFPRLIRGIHWMQVNCVTTLGICCPPLGLVVSRRYPAGQ